MHLRNKLNDLLALVAGASLTFSFAPYHIWPMAFVAIFALLIAIRENHCGVRIWRGWLFGLGHFGTGVSWVYTSMHTYGHISPLIATSLTAVFIMILAVFTALPCYFYNFHPIETPFQFVRRITIFPLLWLAFEITREQFLTGFPWLAIGYSQLNSPLHGFAPLIGVYGLGFLVIWSATAVMTSIRSKTLTLKITALLLLLLLWVSAFRLDDVRWTKPAGKAIPVSIVQANITQKMKWDVKDIVQIIMTYSGLAKTAWTPGIMVWPEAALPITQLQAKELLASFSKRAKQHHTSLILGLPHLIDRKFYNGMLSIGDGKGYYAKRHLVPFGEFSPNISLVQKFIAHYKIPMSNFTVGREHQPLPKAAGYTFAPFICFEIAFPQLLRDTLPKARFLVTITDDAWFGHSNAAAQHLDIARMRSLESGRYQIVSMNNGPSAIIDDQGRILAQSAPNKAMVLHGKIIPMQGKTPWADLR